MATCDTAGTVTITPNMRLCRHISVAVARGVAIVQPDEKFLVKLCNFGYDQVIVRKNSTLGFAEPYQVPLLSSVLDENASNGRNESLPTDTCCDPLEDFDLSEASEGRRTR